VTLKARTVGAWTNTVSISAPGVDATTNSVTINVKTGKGHPKTGHPNNGKAKGHTT